MTLMMKKINNICFVLALAFCWSCGNDYDIDEYFDLEELPGYVAFVADGRDAVLPPFEVDEAGELVEVGVEVPNGSTDPITVNYSLGGDAQFGTDYSIDGATASGGSVVIEPDDSDFGAVNFANIVVQILQDSIQDGDKMLTISLLDAQGASGAIAVGRGGKDFLKEATVIIADVDVPEGE